eukprot:TRINITY_DN1892_c0_g1_i2.p1 TRINITY_DN1892_c0_g1~~TRINITY_DN1892_c0_g1_i2.p1  ORF type:complete len:697 (-),score=90.64 TRINITY_DN1892_c0_g1_i2:79-1914(-)
MEAKAQLAAREARAAFQTGQLASEHVIGLAQSYEHYYKALAGGVGHFTLAENSARCREFQEKQTLAHILHCMLFAAKSWTATAKSSMTMSRRWARRVASALVHIRFHRVHLEQAERAVKAKHTGSIRAAHKALDDFRPLKYDKYSSLLFYFRGRLRRLLRPETPSVLILTCSFGGGHRAAAQAVKSYFKGRAETNILDTSKDPVFMEKDLVHHFGTLVGHPEWDQTTMFNDVILKRQLYRYVNLTEGFGKLRGSMLEEGKKYGIPPRLNSPVDSDSKLKSILRLEFLKYHPDLVVTVYHMDLNPVMSLCEELGSVPLLHMATDLDVKMWEVVGRAAPAYPKFCCGVPFDIPLSWQSADPLIPSQVYLSGYPVRPEFLVGLPDKETVRTQRLLRGLAEGERLVLVMTGGGGQDVPWPEMLANSTTWGSTGSTDGPLRVTIVAGKNASIVERLGKVLRKDGETGLFRGSNELVTVEVASDPAAPPAHPYFVGAKALHALMDVASVAISKPGGGSTSELAYAGVPAVLDASKGAMHWEEFTIKRFVEAKRAVALRGNKSHHLEAALRQALELGRDMKLALGPDGKILDTGQRLLRQAGRLCGFPFEKRRSRWML